MFCVPRIFKVKLSVQLLCVCAICALPGKAVPEMIYTVSGGTLNPTHSLYVAMIARWRLPIGCQ